jgi:hypothetical protein
MAFESTLMSWIVIEIFRYRCPAPLSGTRRDPRHYKYTSDHKAAENSTDIVVLMTNKTVISANTSDSCFYSRFYKVKVTPLIKIILLDPSRTWKSNLADNHKHVDRNYNSKIILWSRNGISERLLFANPTLPRILTHRGLFTVSQALRT